MTRTSAALLVVAAMGGSAHADDGKPGDDDPGEASVRCNLDDAGALIVKSNADGGTVLIDNQPKGTIRNGTATIVLPKGTYRLAISADGYRRKRAQVEIAAGEATEKALTLRSAIVEPPTIWKPVFAASLVAGIGSMAFSAYGYHRMRSEAGKVDAYAYGLYSTVSSDDCGRADLEIDHFASACAWRRRSIVTSVMAGGFGALALVAGYMAFVRDRTETPPVTRTAARRRDRPIAVLPTVSPDGAGATVQLDW